MLTRGCNLHSDADFENAMLFMLEVTIWVDGFVLDYSGVIQFYNEETVTIHEISFSRVVFEFRVR